MRQPRKIKQVPVTKLRPYWRNPRKNENAIGMVADSITRFGFVVPIVTDASYEIICGHTRYQAALLLGIKNVPVVITDLSEEKARQYRIADNKTSEFATWDMEALSKELQVIEDIDSIKLFFEGDRWVDVLKNLTGDDYSEDPDENGAGGESNTSKNSGLKSNTEETTCPHCGEDNTVLIEGDRVTIIPTEEE